MNRGIDARRLFPDNKANEFEDDSSWRDLVSFTWNIKTLEGKENIKARLTATIPEAKR